MFDGVKRTWNRWRGRSLVNADTTTPLGFKVNTSGVEADLDYLDLVLQGVCYWGGIRLDSKELPIRIHPACQEHGPCCFLMEGQHYHGMDDGKVIHLSKRMCTAHHLIGRAITGKEEGDPLFNVYDRLDMIGKDYD